MMVQSILFSQKLLTANDVYNRLIFYIWIFLSFGFIMLGVGLFIMQIMAEKKQAKRNDFYHIDNF